MQQTALWKQGKYERDASMDFSELYHNKTAFLSNLGSFQKHEI